VLAHFKQLDFLNAGHYQHLFPKMLGFATKRLFTSLEFVGIMKSQIETGGIYP